MKTSERPLLATAADRRRLREAMRLQEIEQNPLDAGQVALFEMFEREGWSEQRCVDHVLRRARKRVATGRNAAE